MGSCGSWCSSVSSRFSSRREDGGGREGRTPQPWGQASHPHMEAAPAAAKKRKSSKKKNQPGKYSQLVVETIRRLGERGGSSLARIYAEARKVAWFDQQNGRTYLKYSIKALVQNDTLLQVKGWLRLRKGSLQQTPCSTPYLACPGRLPSPPPALLVRTTKVPELHENLHQQLQDVART
ncbi:Histone H1x [Fukomys damarensis]|uniref:Histone H1x n=1 Tax=Fukomys damarensis TaxID=885580 RepID=A0A091ERH6_FUKDA|nr:Histone H1x [Fukomys damarensis]